MPGSAFSQSATYEPAADTGPTDCFAGASTIRATPMTTRTAEPHSRSRALAFWNAMTAITVAWAKLDQAAKAIRLRFADGFRTPINNKIPSVK